MSDTKEQFQELLLKFPLEFEHLLIRAQSKEHTFNFVTTGKMMQFRAKFYAYLRILRAHPDIRPDLYKAARLIQLTAGTGLNKHLLTLGPVSAGWEAQLIREALGLMEGEKTQEEVRREEENGKLQHEITTAQARLRAIRTNTK